MAGTPRIIGLAGTNGAGKDSVGALLADYYNYRFISFSDEFRAECERRGLPTTRPNTRAISAEWRRKYGLAVMVDRALATYKKDAGGSAGVVIANLRNPYEADRVHELGGIVVWVDGDPQVRYKRVRASGRGRADDERTFEQFLQDEADEMHPPAGGDAANLNMAAVKERADITIMNDSDSLEQLRKDVTAALGL